MSDWKEFSLGDVADPNDRYSFSGGPFGSNLKSEEYTESGVRIIQLQNIGDGIFKDDYKIYTSEEKADELSSCNIYPGEIILSKMGDPVARATLIPDTDERYLMASDGIRLKVDQTRFDPTFVLSAINSPQFRYTAEAVSVGSTRKRIGLTTLKGLTISAPPLPEQKKIAEILSGIDHLIAIANRRMLSELDLRAGLLKEMISEDGAFLKLDSVSTRVSGHTPSKSNPEYWNGGIPWISLSDTAKLDKRYISDTAKEISGQGIQNSSAVLHPAGLVVLSRDARVGCSAITTKKMAVSQHFIGWICSEQLLNRYLYYVLQKWKNKFEAIAMGSTIPTIGVPFFRDLEIPVPPMSEQRKIADTIESVDCHIEKLGQRIGFLQNLKSAVASDILSGRKRVSV